MLYVQTEDPKAEFGHGATGMRPAGFTAPPIAPPPSGRRGRRRWRCQGSPDAGVTGQTQQTGTDGKHRCPHKFVSHVHNIFMNLC